MPHEEVYRSRDRTYSAWHRRNSTRRYVGIELAQSLGMIDLDASLYVEYDDGDKEPVALIETARDVGQAWKAATVTQRLAQRCKPILPAYCVLYTPGESPNPADKAWPDIIRFRVRRIWPESHPKWHDVSPAQWAAHLVKLRRRSGDLIDQSAGIVLPEDIDR